MNTKDFELQLLDEYRNEASQANDPKVLSQKIALYEKQLSNCRDRFTDVDFHFEESLVYYFRARHKLLGAGFLEKTIRSTAQQASDLGTTIYAGVIAKGQEERRARQAISLLGKAIQIYENPYYLLLRAELYNHLKDKSSALKDVNHLLESHSDDPEVYASARKLQDTIETSGGGGCFIATAVYGPSDKEKINVLRDYRDFTLLDSYLGRLFVRIYYAISPDIADILSNSETLQSILRHSLLDPVVRLISKRSSRN